MPELRVSVRELANFCHRSGDIDHRFHAAPTGPQGIAGHQRLYRRRPASYQAEFPVAMDQPLQPGGLVLQVRGRADGYDAERGVVEEIKTCRVDPATIPPAVTRLHLAQARLYAAMIARAEELPKLDVRLTWLHLDSDREYPVTQGYARDELEEFFADTLRRFAAWIRHITALRQQRDQSLQALAFPHPEFRAGQREIAELVYKCAAQAGHLLLEAPTGVGKTAAVLFPALKALAQGKHEVVVFATAKTVGRRAAEQTLASFRAGGFSGKALSLSAREKVCLAPGKACHGDDCPYARGYYDKLPKAMAAALEQPTLRREELEALAREFEVCPYQLAWDMLPWMDVIIADLHYLYGLGSGLIARFSDSGVRATVLVDEAHNLPGRARDMYSAELAKAELMAAIKVAPPGLASALGRVNRALLALQRESWRESDWDSREVLPEKLVSALQELTVAVAGELAAQPLLLQRQPALMSWYFAVLQFLRVAEQWGPQYRFELSRATQRQSLRLRLNCLDAGPLLASRQRALHAVVTFSATLSPWQWARNSLGLSENAVCHRGESPFDAGQLQVRLATAIDTRFAARRASLPALAQTLSQWLLAVPGNCLLYFPSYQYLQDCLSLLQTTTSLEGQRHFWVQEPAQSEPKRDELLDLLGQRRNVAAFCILGGVFGEGIDLPGDQLSSVVVVGVGLPQVNRDSASQRDYFELRYGAGFAYAYQYPGMQKVSQALGRVIRGPTDSGSALLIDSRYRDPGYRALLPRAWRYTTSDATPPAASLR